jgi:hypothetical protein
MTSVPPPPGTGAGPRPRRAPDWRRLGLIAVIGVLVAVAAVGIARMLDDPVGGSTPDEARPAVGGAVAGLVPTDTTPGDTTPTTTPLKATDVLGPYSMVLAGPLPERLSDATATVAVTRLEARLREKRSLRRIVELAYGYQRVDQPEKAAPLFSEALRLRPGYLPARIGIATIPGETGGRGLLQSRTALAALRREFPRSQIVIFNQGWIALYLRDGPAATKEFETVERLGPKTALGRAATAFLIALSGQVTTTGP